MSGAAGTGTGTGTGTGGVCWIGLRMMMIHGWRRGYGYYPMVINYPMAIALWLWLGWCECEAQ